MFAVISSISASIDYVLYVSKETKAKAYITDNFGRSCCKTNEEINIRLMADKSSLQLELNNVIQKLGQKVRRIICSSQEENLLTSVISVNHFRLTLWDAATNTLVGAST